MGLLSNDRLSFGPFKPIVLRGSPEEDASTVFTSHVTLTLAKPEKLSSIIVTLRSISLVYFPEGIGARASRTTFEKTLNKQSLTLLEQKTEFSIGEHRFPFTFIVPNSLVDTIEDEFGRVRHVVEVTVNRKNKKSILNQWKLSKPVLVLRTFLSNSLLLNHTVQDLSQTFDRHLTAADVTIMVDVAVFSPGDLFTLLFTIQPHQKHVRLEHIEATVTESRRYAVSELKAWRTTSDTFLLRYLDATSLTDLPSSTSSSYSSTSSSSNTDLAMIFDRQGSGLDLMDTFSYRVTFATPTCKSNIHHTTHYDDISFRHRLDIRLTVSYLEESGERVHIDLNSPTVSSSSPTTTSSTITSSGAIVSSSPTSSAQAWQNVLLKLRKGRPGKYDEDQHGRQYEKVVVSTPIHVFDCRLKEDYGSLPSYFETGLVKPRFTTIMPTETGSSSVKQKGNKIQQSK
ncbi:uncharacterized protein BX664DRAFT_194304 [Halteromyces radiatus]|uniref:uncharacterized protein n=1 Tax=Halteromyces radiatus TaxID=101107 RepID=UPI002220A04F|nr:uncharacterized protein BX664DRAFT_194304 [Halteromyces radiatus]KAI8081460.1 hypothetical protein BX664DRAFT_194304 [Halteromyces radiatus]